MGEDNFQSIGDILKEMKTNPEKVHEQNINRLIQEFGKKYESEVIGIYKMERSIVEKGNSIPLKIISTRINMIPSISNNNSEKSANPTNK